MTETDSIPCIPQHIGKIQCLSWAIRDVGEQVGKW